METILSRLSKEPDLFLEVAAFIASRECTACEGGTVETAEEISLCDACNGTGYDVTPREES